jgi:hypothetical protein
MGGVRVVLHERFFHRSDANWPSRSLLSVPFFCSTAPLVAIDRNWWSPSIGTTGRLQSEQVVAITWCAHSVFVGGTRFLQ